MKNTGRSFAEALRFHRQQAKLTQKALARMCGISRTYVVMLEKAEAPPPSDEVIANLEKNLDLERHFLRSIAHFERCPKDIQKKVELLSEELLASRRKNRKLLKALVLAMAEASSANDGLREKLAEIAARDENIRDILEFSSSQKTSPENLIQAISDLMDENVAGEIQNIPEQIEPLSKQGYS